jgi:hypothetical protein
MGCSKDSAKDLQVGVPTLKKKNREISNKIKYLKLLEKQEQAKPKTNNIIMIRAEINEIEIKITIQRINKIKNWFFEKINKINKPSANQHKEREKIKINTNRHEKWNVTENTNEIQRIIREYFEDLY